MDEYRAQIQNLTYEIQNLTSEYNTTKDELIETQGQLLTANSQIDLIQNELNKVNEEFSIQSIQLVDIEGQLALSESKLATTESQLANTKSELTRVSTRLDAAQNENIQMLDGYADLRDEIYMRLGDNEDCQAFITPENPAVIEIVMKFTGTRAEDINKVWEHYKVLYNWVVNNIEYSHDSRTPILPISIGGDLIWSKDFWRMPEETIEDGIGDCEDMAVLLMSLLEYYNQGEYTRWCIEIRNEDTGHLAVAIPVLGDKLTILDPAGNYYTNQWGFLSSSDVRTAINDWLNHWKQKIPGAKVTGVFSDEFYREFSNTEEFIQWVIDR